MITRAIGYTATGARRRVLAAGLAWSLAMPTTVVAAERVAAPPLHVEGELDAAPRAELEAAMSRGLQRVDVEQVAIEALPASCDAACVRKVVAAANVRTLVTIDVTAVDRNYTLGLRVFDASSGEVRAESTATCELCGTAEVATLLEDQLGALAPKLVAPVPAKAKLFAISRPSGALVRVDGRSRGPTPIAIVLAPGRHHLRAEKRGFVATERDVLMVAGVDERIELELAPQRRGRPVLGAIALATGVALAGTGAALWAIDERPYRRRCDGDDVDFAGRCRYRFDTLAAGIAVTSIGVAAIVTGIVLLARRRRR